MHVCLDINSQEFVRESKESKKHLTLTQRFKMSFVSFLRKRLWKIDARM